MARTVKFITEATWYVPNIGDNRSDPSPFRVQIVPMSYAEFMAVEWSSVPRSDNGDDGVAGRVRHAEMSAIRKHVVAVENYSISINGDTYSPKNGEELAAAMDKAPASERAMVRDILGAIEDHSKLSAGALGK